MKQIPYIPFYVQDFIGSPDVKMMSMEEVGCYTTLLMNLYANGGQLPNDPDVLKRLCGGIAVASAVARKFYIVGDFLRNERADEIIKKYHEKSKKQSENANKRWRKPNSKPMPSHMPSHIPRQCQSESESYINNIKEKSFEHPIVQNLCKTLLSECEKQKMECRVDADLFKQIYEEFGGKINLGKGIKDCIFNRKKNHHTFIDAGNLRFWFQKGIQLEKDFERRKQTKAADKAAAIGRPQHTDQHAKTPQIEDIAEKMTWN